MAQIIEIKKEDKEEKEEEPCSLCKIGNRECDCDKCGVWGCYECVSGGWGKDEDLNLCLTCEEN